MEETTATTETPPFLGEDWFDPLETAVRGRIRGFIEEMLEGELDAALQRGRYDRHGTTRGHRHGHRARQLVGTFGPVTLSVPRARLAGTDGRPSEWRNQTIPAYRRLTKRAEALIAGAYLSGTNTRRVRRALGALFGGSSGCGFMNMTQRLDARDELAKIDRFIGPNYQHPDDKVERGLNTIWEHIFGERLKYPKPRYEDVIIANPSRFDWILVNNAPGVAHKILGAFSERAAWIEMVQIDKGARWCSTRENDIRLLFVLDGSGSAGNEFIEKYAGIQIDPGETASIAAREELSLFLMGLPPVIVPDDSVAEFETVDGAADDRV